MATFTTLRYPIEGGTGYWALLHALTDRPPPTLPKDAGFSEGFQGLLSCMLNQDPTQRWRADQLLEHPFLANAAAATAAKRGGGDDGGGGDGGGNFVVGDSPGERKGAVPVVEKDQAVANALRIAETKQGWFNIDIHSKHKNKPNDWQVKTHSQ